MNDVISACKSSGDLARSVIDLANTIMSHDGGRRSLEIVLLSGSLLIIAYALTFFKSPSIRKISTQAAEIKQYLKKKTLIKMPENADSEHSAFNKFIRTPDYSVTEKSHIKEHSIKNMNSSSLPGSMDTRKKTTDLFLNLWRLTF